MEPLLFSTGVVFWFIGQTTLGLTDFEISISVFHLWNQIGSSNLVGGRSYWSFKLFSAIYLEEILFSSSSRLTFWIVPLFSTHPISHSTPDKEVGVSVWERWWGFQWKTPFECFDLMRTSVFRNVKPDISTFVSKHEKRRLLLFNRMWPSRQKHTSCFTNQKKGKIYHLGLVRLSVKSFEC